MKWIENADADTIVSCVQKSPTRETMQRFMDLVAGESSYSMSDMTKQTGIRRFFEKECRAYSQSSGIHTNLSVSLDDIVAWFWEGVFKDLPNAQSRGSVVSIRIVAGQDSAGSRPTNCNPINWLRIRGKLSVRNALNQLYGRYLVQTCEDCGNQSKPSSREQSPISCPKCGNDQTSKFWPSGTSGYRSTKQRRCTNCKHTWTRIFAYTCNKCKSQRVNIEYRYEDVADHDIESSSQTDQMWAEEDDAAEYLQTIDGIFKSLPTNGDEYSKTQRILNILTCRDGTATDICTKCKAAAQYICPEKCRGACNHPKIPNPKQTCGAEQFDMLNCINYNKRIGGYQGVSATLTSRRVGTIRQHTLRYMSSHPSDFCSKTIKRLKGA